MEKVGRGECGCRFTDKNLSVVACIGVSSSCVSHFPTTYNYNGLQRQHVELVSTFELGQNITCAARYGACARSNTTTTSAQPSAGDKLHDLISRVLGFSGRLPMKWKTMAILKHHSVFFLSCQMRIPKLTDRSRQQSDDMWLSVVCIFHQDQNTFVTGCRLQMSRPEMQPFRLLETVPSLWVSLAGTTMA